MKEELKRIHHDLKVTIVHVTHNQMEAFSLAERVAVMNFGQIVQVDRAKSLLSSPADEFVARFLGYENIFKGRLVGHQAGLWSVDVGGFVVKGSGDVEVDECLIAIRPENISLSATPAALRGVNVLGGVVESCVDVGPIVSVAVSVNTGIMFKATVAKGSFLEMNLDKGTKVWLSFRPESVRVLNTFRTSP
jgi:ABC-type Fe3+/spermidine/putrescine transport system ATPase subunit